MTFVLWLSALYLGIDRIGAGILSLRLDTERQSLPLLRPKSDSMCYQLVELYAACRCLYYEHAVDQCVSYGRPGHHIERRTIYVGYACSLHTSRSAQYGSQYGHSDSSYYGGHSSSSYR